MISRDDKYYFDAPDSLKYVENRELFNILCRLTDAEKDFLGLRYGLEMSNDEIAEQVAGGADAKKGKLDSLKNIFSIMSELLDGVTSPLNKIFKLFNIDVQL